MGRRRYLWQALSLAAWLATILVVAEAGAQERERKDDAAGAQVKPWAINVSEAAKAQALSIFEKGNAFFEREQYSQALSQYRQAIDVWDHPAIRYNMAICFINLDQPLEAQSNLVKGLAYGVEPLGDRLFAEGRTYMKLLMGRLSRVSITGTQADAEVSLDGEALFSGVASAERILMPGKHQLIAKHGRMMTYTRELVLEAGKKTEITITMVALTEGVAMRRRWPSWKPWALTGTGLGLLAFGGVAYWLADSDFADFDAGVARECPQGCDESELSSATLDFESRGKIESVSATSLLIAGGAITGAGLVMFFLNRPQPYSLEGRAAEGEASLAILPVIAPSVLGVSGELRF